MTIIDTTSDTMTSQFVEEDINRPTGKLTDCQAPFRRRPTAGLNLLGFASGSVAVVAMSRSPHSITFRIVVGLIRFSARFRRADRSSSSVLLSVNERTGVGPVRKRVLSGFAQDPRPSSVARCSTNAAQLLWPSVEIESPNRFQSYLGFVPSTSSSRLLVCEPAHSSTRLPSGTVGTVLIRLSGRDVLGVPSRRVGFRRQIGVFEE